MGPPASLRPPYLPLPQLEEPLKAALEREALRVNDRYLHECIEGHAFCPFARGGRLAGQTSRYVFHADTPSLEPLLALMAAIAADERQVVAQVIVPRVEVSPEAWVRFVDALTGAGHVRLGKRAVLAFAALHPHLRYNTESPAGMVPLFRRAPDPTIQWVRLDAIAEIYEGRDDDTLFVDPLRRARLPARRPGAHLALRPDRRDQRRRGPPPGLRARGGAARRHRRGRAAELCAAARRRVTLSGRDRGTAPGARRRARACTEEAWARRPRRCDPAARRSRPCTRS